MRLIGLLITVLLCVLFGARAQDDNEHCEEWAKSGECDSNPRWMLSHCAIACAEVASGTSPPDVLPMHFYEIVERDLDGRKISFSDFKGQVVYIINVASHCGYTQENYDQFRELKKYRKEGFEMVLAPCAQFGNQEPGDRVAISNFAKEQEFQGIILAKGDVNGINARKSFRFLKNAAGVHDISWNFQGKFLVSRTGEVHSISDPEDLEKMIKALLKEPKPKPEKA